MLQRRVDGIRRGLITVIMAVMLVVLLGFTAIALEGGLMQDNRRRVQNGADAAALAAGKELFRSYTLLGGSADPGGRAAAAAKASANQNMADLSPAPTVTVNIPPASGPFTGKPGYAEVLVTYDQPRYFSSVWGSASTPISARAVGLGYWGGTGNGIIVLDPVVANALDASGTGSVTVTGGAAVLVNSKDSASAARGTGAGSLTAREFNITGGANGTFNGNVVTGTPPVPDPLAYLPVPAMPPNGTLDIQSLGNGNKKYTLSPGRHNNLPVFNTGDEVIFQQASAGGGGIFYIDGGGLKSTGADIKMDPSGQGGVMIYNAPSGTQSSQGINISGNATGSINLSPLTSGPYAGILMFQERSSPVGLSISGQGSFNLKGTFYTANANLGIAGQGDATIGSQYISRTLSLSGNGNITIDYNDSGTARQRKIMLME